MIWKNACVLNVSADMDNCIVKEKKYVRLSKKHTAHALSHTESFELRVTMLLEDVSSAKYKLRLTKASNLRQLSDMKRRNTDILARSEMSIDNICTFAAESHLLAWGSSHHEFKQICLG